MGAKRPSIEPAHLLVFAALARAGGVRSAALALGVPRSTISRQLAALEGAVGAPLVMRHARRFELTELGRELFGRATALEELMRDSEALAQRASGDPSGTLKIDAAPVLAEEVLPEVIFELGRRYPRLAVEVRTAVEYIDLRRQAADVVLRARKLDDANDLFATQIGVSVTGCFVSPSYGAQRGLPSSLDELADHECILVGGGLRSASTWIFAGGSRSVDDRAIEVHGRVRVDSFRIARSVAVLGGGVLRCAAVFAHPFVLAGDLVPVLERHWWRTPLFAAHAGPNPPSPKVRAFLTLVRAATQRALPTEGAGRWRSV